MSVLKPYLGTAIGFFTASIFTAGKITVLETEIEQLKRKLYHNRRKNNL